MGLVQLMTEYFTTVMDSLSTIDSAWAYLFLFVSSIIENVFPPIPGDTITALGAFLVATGKLNYLLVLISTTSGSTVGFVALFAIARRLGRDYFLRKKIRYFTPDAILRAEKRFSKSGYYVVLANRFLPGVRSVISITAGIINLSFYRVLVLSFVSAALWNLLWMQAGYTLGGNWEAIKAKLALFAVRYNMITGIIILILLTAALMRHIYRSRKR
jgi:membrane protein DedA with SNARE-associated domain